jgi:segregation and condensation protein B
MSVTTDGFLTHFGFDSLRDLPNIDRLEEAGLLGKAPLPGELRAALGLTDEADDHESADDREEGEEALAAGE